MRRMIFQKDAQEDQLAPIGFSTRVQVIGTGNVREMSVSEKKPIPGRLGLLQTHPLARARVPKATAENLCGRRKSP
jgi:hypothetical protein